MASIQLREFSTTAESTSAKIIQVGWSDERVATLKELALKGMTAGQMARSFSVTRSSIIGKIHRDKITWNHGWNVGPKPKRSPAPHQKPSRLAFLISTFPTGNSPPRPPRSPVVRSEFEATPATRGDRTCSFIDLTDKTCRWPIGDPGTEGFCFCGELPDGGPYCANHMGIGHWTRPPRQEFVGEEE